MSKLILTIVAPLASAAASAFTLIENGSAKPVLIPANAEAPRRSRRKCN